jgi:RecB family exonuclease
MKSRGGKQLFRGSFRELEIRFTETVRELRGESAIAPMAVLVPTGLLRLYLKRALAGNGVSHANIRFMTFSDLAERLAGPGRRASAGTTPIPPFGMELLLAAVLEEMKGALPHFSSVVEKEGFGKALLATFRDLADGWIEPEDLETVLLRLKKDKTTGLSAEKLSEITAVWKDLEKRRKSLGFESDAEVLKAAAQAAWNSEWLGRLHAFLVYGFYDFTFAQKKLLQACLEKTRGMVWFPHRDGPAFRYAEPALRWFQEIGFNVVEACEEPEAGAEVLKRLRDRIFLPPGEKEKARPEPPRSGDFLILSTPGEEKEAKEVVREVMHPPEGAAGKGGTTGILLPARDPYTNLIAEALEACGVEGCLHRGLPLSRTLAGRSLLSLAKLMGSDFRRADVMDFLLTAPLKPQSWRGGKSEAAPAAEWNYFTMIAGIVEGKEEWARRLGDPATLVRRAVRLSGKGPAEDPEEEDETETGTDRYASRIASVRALRQLVLDLFQKVGDAALCKRWSEMADGLSSLYTDLLETDDETRAVLSVLDELAKLDALSIDATPDMFYRFLKESLEEGQERKAGSFQRKEPAIADLMEARGCFFDTVILPGMVEKRFPHPVRQDPVLLDWEREKLNALFRELKIEGGLPLKKRRKEEEELLFALALGSARSRLILTFPRLDIGKGRPLVPSFFLLKALEAVEGGTFDYETFEKYLREGRCGRTVALSSFQPALRQRAIDRPEYDLASLAAAEKTKEPKALLYLLKESAFFARSLAAETARWGSTTFTEFDGLIRAPALLERIGRSFHPAEMKISATQLEEYAACPFHYFLRRILKIEPLEEPEEAVSISPLDLGSMVHSILWEFFTEMDRAQRIPLKEECRNTLLEIARRHFLEFQKAGVTGYPLLWEIEKERVTADLNQFFDKELQEQEFVPRYFEVRFGSPARDREESDISTEEAVPFEAAEDVHIHLRGRIDRIDCDSARNLLKVIDYKTGKPKSGMKDNALLGGKALQLPLYLWAAEKLMTGKQGDRAEYYYATEKGGWKRPAFTRAALKEQMPELAQIVSTIVKGIAAGRFYAVNANNQCSYCDFRYACGHGKYLDFKWEHDAEAAGPFVEMSGIK